MPASRLPLWLRSLLSALVRREKTVESSDERVPFQLEDEPEFEDIGVRPLGYLASSRGAELAAVEGNHTEAESHQMTSVGWVLHTFITPPQGTIRLDGGRPIPLSRTMFLPPGFSLEWRSAPCLAAVCNLSAEFMASLLEAEPHLRLDAIDRVVAGGPERLFDLGQRAFREALSPGLGATLLTEAMALELVLEIVRYDDAPKAQEGQLRGGLAPWQMRRLEAYVHEHLSGDLSLQSLSALLNMSVRHLSRVIKREKGVSVHQWIADLRLAETQRLLAETDQPLHEIAQRAAFKSAAAFSTAFRAACGFSPSEYRRLALG